MKRTTAALVAILTAFAGAPARAGARAEVPAEVRARAAGVFAALDKIAAERVRPVPPGGSAPLAAPGSRSVDFSEAEFNAYVACRLDEEMEAYVKSAEFRLLAGNRIEGRVAVDFGKPQASGALPRKHDLLFAARFETRDGQVRIDMDKLFLGAQPVAPAFVDVIIGVAARLQGLEPTGIGDWYDLPSGVLRLETRPGRVVVIY